MKREEIKVKLKVIFQEVFEEDHIEITDRLSAKDVSGWDSLSHMLMIDRVEKHFGIKFKLRELGKMQEVGDLLQLICDKL